MCVEVVYHRDFANGKLRFAKTMKNVFDFYGLSFFPVSYRYHALFMEQCGPVVRALALRSGDPGFKTRSDHSLNLILVGPGSTSQLHL